MASGQLARIAIPPNRISKAPASQDSVVMITRLRRSVFAPVILAISGVFLAFFAVWPQSAVAQGPSSQRCFAIELYVARGDTSADGCIDSVRAAIAGNPGTRLKVHRIDAVTAEGRLASERLAKLAQVYQLDAATTPLIYGLNHALTVPRGQEADQAAWSDMLAQMLRVEVFTRPGCSRCDTVRAYLSKFQAKYPALKIELSDVIAVPKANARFMVLARQQGIGGISFPGISLCRQLVIGFESEASGAARLDSILKKWSFDCVVPPTRASLDAHRESLAVRLVAFQSPETTDAALPQGHDAAEESLDNQEIYDLDIGDSDLPIDFPFDHVGDPNGELSIDTLPGETGGESEIDLPWIGRVSAERLGLPLFTLAIGLVDGFNPCAMWVLLFLLSVLVNLRDRWKILAVAGTFVFISGAAYFAFMAAWLNVLLLVGFLRWVQVTLATLAIVVGSIHVKDFFAFKKGITLSIPESAKPGIYARVRKIVMAENLIAAIAGASVLAVLVNLIELLCTAGLPALYSQILMMQGFPSWKNYAYLGLYVLAYMFDDAVMVSIVVTTLGKRKLQENEGRWLKLVSGLVILLLGIVLLLRPHWLQA
jgi:hypothetical protein